MILNPKEVAFIDRDASFVGGTQHTVSDLLDTIEFYQSLDQSESPCGHRERYAYTTDGGKTIICLLCEHEQRDLNS